VLKGDHNLTPISHLPEVVDLVVGMIDIEGTTTDVGHPRERPLFWSVKKRFQFLCTVGKKNDVVSINASARAALPPRRLLPKVAN
jgi:hypothetical protein